MGACARKTERQIKEKDLKMKLVTLNIRHGGGARVKSILNAIEVHNPDILLLTEFRNNDNGNLIRRSLKENGYVYQEVGEASPKVNTLLLVSKIPFTVCKNFSNLESHSHRLIMGSFETFKILGYYFPQGEDKFPVFDELILMLKEQQKEPFIALGDLNTGKHYQDENGKTFIAADKIDEVEQYSVDAWRLFHKDKKEYSWFSHQGNGFRIDQAFATASMADRLSDVRYSHIEREDKISDHSAMIIEFSPD